MASATVTVKLTPHELQVLTQSLTVLAEVVKQGNPKEARVLGVNWELFGGIPTKALNDIFELRWGLGLAIM